MHSNSPGVANTCSTSSAAAPARSGPYIDAKASAIARLRSARNDTYGNRPLRDVVVVVDPEPGGGGAGGPLPSSMVVVVVSGGVAVGASGPTSYGPPVVVPPGLRCVPGSMPVRAALLSL